MPENFLIPNQQPNVDMSIALADLFLTSSQRMDQWRTLFRHAAHAAAAADPDELAKIRTEFQRMRVLEDYWGYPGRMLNNELERLLTEGDLQGFANGVHIISAALHTNAHHSLEGAWHLDSNPTESFDEISNTGVGRQILPRPYFEVLVVAADMPALWDGLTTRIRELRRLTDDFIYQPVIVESYEDALVAVILNPNIQAVVVYDGFPFRSRRNLPDLRGFLGKRPLTSDPDEDELAVRLFDTVKEVRPELDLYLLSDRLAEQVAGLDTIAAVRRVFFSTEEILEIHLSILEGIRDRFQTPFFDNLEKYAQRPIGTFHALPIARGKSIFKSNWIRDMGEFYGENLFLAESSATTGGLDSLLEPTGNIRKAQELAARAFGADHAFYATNGTSSSNKIVGQALLEPDDIVLIDRDCHKSHHYACVLSGAQPVYLDAFPLTQYSMYGSVPIRTIKRALLELKAEGRLDRVKVLILTNATFDGHMANVAQTMEECLAIKPDLVFLWDEAWSAFARFTPLLRWRTAMSGAAHLRANRSNPKYRQRYQEFAAQGIEMDINDPRALDERLMPDPDQMRVRVYQTTSVHKSMSALRQASLISVADDDYGDVEEAFHEAYFTHTSTSPNLQIIASLDVARRQMELEGYELATRAVELALDLRDRINGNPQIAKYFRALTPADMIPEQYRPSGIEKYSMAEEDWSTAMTAMANDEFFLDPTRVTVLCGGAGMNGTKFKALLADKYDIQINKTSRNSVLVQLNINNTRSDLAHLIKSLSDIARELEATDSRSRTDERERFQARVEDLLDSPPHLPDFSAFADMFRDEPRGTSREGHMREAFYVANNPANCEHIDLLGDELDRRLDEGPPLVGANFVIPYPPGFPLIVPGQIVNRDIIDFLRALDVTEIHGYDPERGLKLLRPEVLAT